VTARPRPACTPNPGDNKTFSAAGRYSGAERLCCAERHNCYAGQAQWWGPLPICFRTLYGPSPDWGAVRVDFHNYPPVPGGRQYVKSRGIRWHEFPGLAAVPYSKPGAGRDTLRDRARCEEVWLRLRIPSVKWSRTPRRFHRLGNGALKKLSIPGASTPGPGATSEWANYHAAPARVRAWTSIIHDRVIRGDDTGESVAMDATEKEQHRRRRLP